MTNFHNSYLHVIYVFVKQSTHISEITKAHIYASHRAVLVVLLADIYKGHHDFIALHKQRVSMGI